MKGEENDLKNATEVKQMRLATVIISCMACDKMDAYLDERRRSVPRHHVSHSRQNITLSMSICLLSHSSILQAYSRHIHE